MPLASLSAAIACFRRLLGSYRQRSERRLDDDDPMNSDAAAAVIMMTRKTGHNLIPSTSASTSAAKGDDFPSSTPSHDYPTYSLHFFIRTMSRTLVIHASPDDTVHSVIKQIEVLTGIPACELRLVYLGRQLQHDSTLEQCNVETDSCVQLTGRLRSTKFPDAWKIVDDLILAINWMNTCQCAVAAAENLENPWKWKSVDSLVMDFLRSTPSADTDEGDDIWGHLQVFVMAGAPAALVQLYLSPISRNSAVAKSGIRLFLNSSFNYLDKCIRVQCAPILLEFCKFLSRTVGKRDLLYVACRDTVSELLEVRDSQNFSHSRSSSVITDLLPFISERATTLMDGLSSESMLVSTEDVIDFSKFLRAMRKVIRVWRGGSGPLPRLLSYSMHPQYEWIGSLHTIFKLLLHKADECLGRVEDIMRQKGAVQSENCWAVWSHLLEVLTELNTFSKIFDGDEELLRCVVVARQWTLNALSRHANQNYRFRWILKHKDVIDFEARRNLVLMMFPVESYYELHEMLIDRSKLLAESFEYIGKAEASVLHGGIFMEFKNEEATGPGVLREWFCLLCREIFNPQNALFLPCPNDHRRFFPNPASSVDPLHLKYLRFCGRVTALALMHKVQVGIVFDRVFFMQLAGRIITLEDVQEADPCFYMSCKKILEMDAVLLDSDVLGLTFVREIELGPQRVVELCPGGKDIVVNSKNRVEYINLLIQHRFVVSVSEQVSKFSQGFADILSKSKLQRFFFQSLDLEDFDRMIGGTDNNINVKEWKAHTEYNGYRAKDHKISWFWKIVEGMTAEQKRVLLFFWTSVKYLPTDGFSGLASKLYIYKSLDSNDHLPTSHTCFYRLCLPSYSSVSIMRRQLQLITQEHVSCTFGFL